MSATIEPLPFPPYMLMSDNHYATRWWSKSHRRLKNVIVVMEWIPAAEQLVMEHSALGTLTAATVTADKSVIARQEERLLDAFNLFDSRRAGKLSGDDVADVVRSMGIETGFDLEGVMRAVDPHQLGVDFKVCCL
jgi:hypothetical protein